MVVELVRLEFFSFFLDAGGTMGSEDIFKIFSKKIRGAKVFFRKIC